MVITRGPVFSQCSFSQQSLKASRKPDPLIRGSRRRQDSCVSTPPTFTPIVVNLRLTLSLPDFQELERLREGGTSTTLKLVNKPPLAHGSVFFSGRISMSCNVFHCWKWRPVPERKGSRTLRCKVVKVVSLEVFLSGPSSDCFSSLQTHGHHGEADWGETSAFDSEQARCFPG